MLELKVSKVLLNDSTRNRIHYLMQQQMGIIFYNKYCAANQYTWKLWKYWLRKDHQVLTSHLLHSLARISSSIISTLLARLHIVIYWTIACKELLECRRIFRFGPPVWLFHGSEHKIHCMAHIHIGVHAADEAHGQDSSGDTWNTKHNKMEGMEPCIRPRFFTWRATQGRR